MGFFQMRFVSCVGLLSAFLNASMTYGNAQENLFMVPEIEVTIPSNLLNQNPFAQAVKKGQQEAYLKLLKKITASPDLTDIKSLTDAEIGKLVSKVDVDKEQRTKAFYKASLNYYFAPNAVKEILNQKGVQIEAPITQKIVLIPVLKANATDVKLWEESNPWKQIWANYSHKNNIKFPYLVPYGDFEDMGIISAQEALEGNTDCLKKIAEKYNCETAIVVLGSVENSESKDKAKFTVSTHYYGNQPYPNLSITLEDQPINSLYPTGFKQLIDKMDENWKIQVPALPLPEKEVEIRIPLFGPADYDLIEEALKKINFIQSIVLLSMTTEEAFIKLKFQENDAQLQEQLSKLNLDLENRDGKLQLSWKKNFTPNFG